MSHPIARLFVFATSVPFVLLAGASGQTSAENSPIGVTIMPCVDISYTANTSTRVFENNHGNSPVKTLVYPDGHEKFVIEDGFFKGRLALDADNPKFFPVGTQFKITTVKPEKTDTEFTLAPISSGNDIGAVKLVFGAGNSVRQAEELLNSIKQMLKVGSCSAPKREETTVAVVAPVTQKTLSAGPRTITLDCIPNQKMRLEAQHEVVFDEAARLAVFERVGASEPVQSAIFTDTQIDWRTPAPDEAHYILSRSSGILTLYNIAHIDSYYVPQSLSYTCTVRKKKF